jgi:hypothetical protein
MLLTLRYFLHLTSRNTLPAPFFLSMEVYPSLKGNADSMPAGSI